MGTGSSSARVAIYLRQSFDRGLHSKSGKVEAELAIRRQREDALSIVNERQLGQHIEFCDNDRSASTGKPRPRFERMLTHAEAGELDVIVVWHLDRLLRRPMDLERLIELASKQALKILTVYGDLDLNTPGGRHFARNLAANASYEVEHKSERHRRSNRQRIDEGLPTIGGPRVLGYEADKLTVVEAEAASIRKAYADLLAGRTCAAIARDLNAAGHMTTMGNPWTGDSVRKLLPSARFAGFLKHRDEDLRKAVWPAIVDEATWRAACAILKDPSRRTNPHPAGAQKWLGTSVYRCGVCAAEGIEETLTVAYRRAGARIYRCRRSKHLSRTAEVIDEFVEDMILRRLQRDDARELLVDRHRPDAAELEQHAQKERDKLLSIQAAFDDDDITETQYRQGSKRAKAKLAEIEGQMADTSRIDALGDLVNAEDVEAEWELYDIERKKAAILALCRVTVYKGQPGGSARGGKRKPLQPGTVSVDFQKR